MAHPCAIVVPLRLDSLYYHEWVSSVKTVRGYGLADHLADNTPFGESSDGSGAKVVKA